MINRTKSNVFLSQAGLGPAAVISVALFAIIPVLALLVWFCGLVVWLVAWAFLMIISVFFLVIPIVGLIWVVLGIMRIPRGGSSQDEGCGFIVLGGMVIGLGLAGRSPWANIAEPAHELIWRLTSWGYSAAHSLIVDVWIRHEIYGWSWVVLGTALAIALALLAMIAFLRCYDLVLGRLQGIYLTCPSGHRSGISFGCMRCGAWEDHLIPSRYGILKANCVCGAPVGTSHLTGRQQLAKQCLDCRRRLTHPRLGSIPEHHVVIWGTAGTSKTSWMEDALTSALVSRAQVVEEHLEPEKSRPLPAPMVSFSAEPRGLLYLYDLPENDCQLSGRGTDEKYQTWFDAIVLVFMLSLDTSESTSIQSQIESISALLDRWNRLHPGRSRRHHPAPLAVVVRWQGQNPGSQTSARAALESKGFGSALLVLEASFRQVRYFLVASSHSSRAVNLCPAHEPLEWLDKIL